MDDISIKIGKKKYLDGQKIITIYRNTFIKSRYSSYVVF
jgi:hypothetical protein